MNNRLLVISLILCSLVGILSGCTGKGPFRMVQLCLHDEQNVALFKDTMKSLSKSHGMNYVDRSAASQRESIALKLKQAYPLINIGGIGKDGTSWGAGNGGLPAYEVGLGFTEGSNPAAAHRFADMVIRELKQKWPVDVLPPGRGAFPMKTCM